MTQYELANAVRHEIGHAIGLGEYDIADDEQSRIRMGSEDSPSIMDPYITANNFYTINPIDVNEVKRIYGLGGFHTNNFVVVNSTIPLWVKDDAMDCCSAKRGLYVVDSVLLRDMTVTGLIQPRDAFFQDGLDSTNSLRYQFNTYFKNHIVERWINGTIDDKEFLSGAQYLLDHGQIIK
jgi:hypothetical protein